MVMGPHQLTPRLIGAFILGSSALLFAGASFAAEGPNLPPAEYKPLPERTRVKYDNWSYTVTTSDGFNTVVKTNLREWLKTYGVFGRHGIGSYTVYSSAGSAAMQGEWEAVFDEKSKSALESLWPLTVGKKVGLNFEEEYITTYGSEVRAWRLNLEVTGTELLELNGSGYPTFVVRSHASSENPSINYLSSPAHEYSETYWYNPGSGLVLKFEREWVRGNDDAPGKEYKLIKVTYPKGTTNLALKGERIGKEADKRLIAEVQALKQKAEAARRAEAEQEKARKAEIARIKREAEKAQEAEFARIKREAEESSKAEIARLKKEAEEARKSGSARADKARAAEIASLEKEVEQRHWDSIRDSKELASVEDYLKQYPQGKFAQEAKARVAVLQRLASANKIDFGNYHALVIGINDYKYLPKLQMAVNDARAVAKVLKNGYGFKVTLLIDPARGDILDAFDEYQETLTGEDNLLIYYAGHGWLNEEVDRGYWLPANAKPKRRRGWVSNATITDTLKGLSAKHVMVIADSCYSGTLVRAAKMETRKRTGDYWKEMSEKWARVAITSGGLEPVADKGGGDNSPFAKAFIDTLGDNKAVMDGTTLFSKMRRPVMVNAEQTPQYSDVRNAGHDGGDFLFVRKK